MQLPRIVTSNRWRKKVNTTTSSFNRSQAEASAVNKGEHWVLFYFLNYVMLKATCMVPLKKIQCGRPARFRRQNCSGNIICSYLSKDNQHSIYEIKSTVLLKNRSLMWKSYLDWCSLSSLLLIQLRSLDLLHKKLMVSKYGIPSFTGRHLPFAMRMPIEVFDTIF